MAIRKQLTVFLENKIGILSRMTETFRQNGINLDAIMVFDSSDHSFLRMIVNDPIKARDILEERGVLVIESDVIVVTIPNKSGMLHEIAVRLQDANINIDYLYGSSPVADGSVQLVLHTANLEDAEKALGF
mgnify:FL=1